MKKKNVFAIVLLVAAVGIAVYELFGRPDSEEPEASEPSSGQAVAAESQTEAGASCDTIWLQFEGTDIDDPVMQAEDNEYYLRRNEKGEPDVWGCYFMDYECSPTGRNIIVYGHSAGDNIDDERFSQLKRLNDEDFAKEYNILTLTINGETRRYQIFSSGYASALTDNMILEADPDSDTMQEIISLALARSQHDYGVAVGAEDELLTLCTCTTDGDMRYVVWAKRIYD